MNNLSVAFIANFHKTIFFYEISKVLEESGVEVFWFSSSKRWTDWLLKQGVLEKKVFSFDTESMNWRLNSIDDHKIIYGIEENNGVQINDIILMDRFLRELPFEQARNYLNGLSINCKSFIQLNNISAIFGEQTWSHEIIIAQVAKLLGKVFARPHVVRVPDGRFGFFKEHHERELFESNSPAPEPSFISEMLNAYVSNKPKPSYFALNNRTPSFKLGFVSSLAKHLRISSIEKNNLSHYKVSFLVKNKLLSIMRMQYIRFLKPFDDRPDLEQKFVLYTLHVQPEHSIDVLGSRFSNQLQLIEQLSRSLPQGHMLYVKEHSNALGNRGRDFYQLVNRLPATKLVSPYINSADLIQKAECTISVSGTACYEAGLFGHKALCLAEMFFKPVLQRDQYNPWVDELSEILNEPLRVNRSLAEAALGKVYKNSYPGYISDPKSDPRCIKSDNIKVVSEGFLDFLKFTFNQG